MRKVLILIFIIIYSSISSCVNTEKETKIFQLVSETMDKATVAEKNGDFQLAIGYYHFALATSYSSQDEDYYKEIRQFIFQFMGNCELESGKYNEAIDFYSKSISINPSAMVFFLRAEVKTLINDIEGSCEDYKKAKEMDNSITIPDILC